MNRELEQQLWFEKVGSLEQLEQAGLANLRDEPGVRRLVALNAGLLASADTAAPWTAPERDDVITSVLGGKSSAPEAPQARTGSRRWLGYAVASVVILLAALGVVQALRLAREGGLQLPGGEALRRAVAPAGVAWAEVDGYVLEYQLAFDDYFSGTAADPPDHPVWLMNNVVEQWAADNGISCEPSSSESYAQFQLDKYEFGGAGHKRYKGLIQVKLIGLGEGVLNSLQREFEQLDWLPDPEIYSQTLYLSDKYPNTHYLGRKIVINGAEFSYPQNFAEDEAKSLQHILKVFPSEHGTSYFAFFSIGNAERIPLADVVKVQYGDTLYIDDYVEHFDRSKLKLLSFEPTVDVFIPGDEVDEEYDPLELLTRVSGIDKLAFYRTKSLQRKGYKLVANLPTDNPQRYITEVAEAAQTWAENYPEIADGGELAHLLAVEPVEIDSQAVQVQVTLWINDKELAEELFSTVRTHCPGRSRIWRALPSLEEIRSEAQPMLLNREHREIRFTLVDSDDSGRTDLAKTAAELSEDRKQWSQEIKQDIIEAFNSWSDDHNPRPPGQDCSIGILEVGGVAFSVSIYTELSGPELQELALRARVPGAPKPEILSRDPGDETHGLAVAVNFFPLERLVGLGPEDIRSSFRPFEFQYGESKLEELSAAIDGWQASQADASGSAAPPELDTYVIRFGGLAVGASVSTSLPHGAQADSLAALLESVVEFPVTAWEPGNFNAGPRETPQPKFERPSTEEMSRELLAYDISLDRAYMLYPAERHEELLSERDWQHLRDLIEAMKTALDSWNAAYPPDSEKGEEPFTIEISEFYGIPNRITVLGNRVDEDLVLSVAAALREAGAPDYEEGFGYRIRNTALSEFAEPHEITGTQWSYRLIPQVRWMGRDMDEVAAEFTDAERSELVLTEAKVREAFDGWLELHAEISESTSPIAEKQGTASYMTNTIGGTTCDIFIRILVADDERRQALTDELIQLIENTSGLKRPGNVRDYTATVYY